MSQKTAATVFQSFSQGDSSTSRKFGGTGLGLPLSRQIARALGGDVYLLESELGSGSTFVATVKSNAPNLTRIAKLANARKKSANSKVLLVEDSLDNQDYIKLLLEQGGMEVDLANNGKEGVSIIGAAKLQKKSNIIEKYFVYFDILIFSQ